jgi:hypothetical protein
MPTGGSKFQGRCGGTKFQGRDRLPCLSWRRVESSRCQPVARGYKGRGLAFGFSSVILNRLSPVVRAQPLGPQQIHKRLNLVRRLVHRRPVVVIKPVVGVIGNGLCAQIRRPCQSPGRPPVEADSKPGLASRPDFGVALAQGAGQAGGGSWSNRAARLDLMFRPN